MITDFDVLELDEIIELLVNEESLNERIAEAIDLINNDGEEEEEEEEENEEQEQDND